MSVKKCSVVMLPTNDKSSYPELWLMHNKSQGLMHLKTATGLDGIGQHLYLLSDEEIKEGNWFVKMNHRGGKPSIYQERDKPFMNSKWLNSSNVKDCFKIIATTNKFLSKESAIFIQGENNPINVILPQLPQSFIEKFVDEYNKGYIIAEVMVEYKEEKFIFT